MEGVIDMSATTVIKDILTIKNMSQVELAEEINVTRQNLSNKMNRDKFSALELVEIADALGMKLVLKEKDSINEEDLKNNKEFIIDYPNEIKGKSKRNQTEEEKKAAQEKSMQTKAKHAKMEQKQ